MAVMTISRRTSSGSPAPPSHSAPPINGGSRGW